MGCRQGAAATNAFGRMDNLDKLQETLGLALKRNCLDLCRCATVTCWGLLWI